MIQQMKIYGSHKRVHYLVIAPLFIISRKLETTKISIILWKDNAFRYICTMECYSAIKRKVTNCWYTSNMKKEFQKNYDKWNKPETKQYILCKLIYINFLKGKNYSDRKQIRVCKGLKLRDRLYHKGTGEKFGGGGRLMEYPLSPLLWWLHTIDFRTFIKL